MRILTTLVIIIIFQIGTIDAQAQKKPVPKKTTSTGVAKPAAVTAKSQAPVATPQSAQPKAAVVPAGPPSFMLGGTSDISSSGKERWLGMLLDNALEFKCAQISQLNLIMSSDVYANIPGFGSIAAPPTEREYFDVARKLKATYIGKAKYEFSGGRDVQYYLEIVSVADGNTFATIERSFNVEKIGTEIDLIISDLLKSLKITPGPELARFLRFPIISEDVKNMKIIGEYLFNSRFSSAPDNAQTVDNFKVICAKDRPMLIAFWYGGFIFENAGLNIDAIEAFKVVNQTFPEYLNVYVPLIRANRKAGRFENAQSVISLAEQRGIRKADLLVEKALVAQALKKTAEAENIFKQILSVDPDNAIALLNYARKCNDEGRGVDATNSCNRYIKANKPTAAIYVELGRSLMLQKKKDEAIKAFVRATQLDSKNPAPLAALGDLYLSNKSFAEASKYYDKALLVSPENIELAVNAALAYKASGNVQKSLDLLRKMEPRYPQHPVLNRELGMLEYARKENDKAMGHLEVANREGLTDPQSMLALGLLYVDTKQYVKALPLLNKALPLIDNKTECKIGLAKIQLALADTDAAVKLLDELSLQKVTIPGAYLTIADKYYGQGNKVKSYEFYKKEYASNKDDASVLKKIAEISFELSLWQDSKNAYAALAAKDPKDVSALYKLAILSLQLKDAPGASAYVKKAAALGNAEPDLYYRLGLGFKGLNATKDAAIAFQKCVTIDPSNEKALLELGALLVTMKKDSAAADVNFKLFDLNSEKYKDRAISAASMFENAGAYDKAQAVCNAFLKKNYTSPEISMQLARLEYRAKNYAAVTAAAGTIPVAKLDTMMLRILAESFSNTQQYKKVLSYTSSMVQKQPSSVWAAELSAVAHDKNGSPDQAAVMYKKYATLTNNQQKYGVRLGELLVELKQFKNAIDHYEILSRTNNKEGLINGKLAELYFKTKDYTNAIAQARKALTFANAPNELNLIIGRAAVLQNNQAAAVEGFTKYLKTAESDTAALNEFGKYAYNNKDYKNAADAFANALRFGSDNFAVRKMLGISLLKLGDQAKAVPQLEKALEYQKTDKEIITLLAGCYTTSGDKTSVIKALQNLSAVDKTNFEVRKQLGDMLYANEQYADAANVYEEATMLKRCQIDIHLKLADIYARMNKQELVGGQLRSALGCDSKNPDVYYQVYLYFNSRQDTVKAMDYLKQTLDLAPSHPEATQKLGEMLLASNRPADAVSYLTRSVKTKPDVKNKTLLVQALYRANKSADAVPYVKSIAAPDTRDPEILKWSGFVMKATGNTDIAIKMLERAVQVESSCGQCYFFLGDLYYETGNYDESVKNYQAANSMVGFSETVAMKIGHIYSLLGREAQARNAWEAVIQKRPQNMEAWYRILHSYIITGQADAFNNVIARVGNDNSGWISLAKGELLESQGQIEAAFKAWETAFAVLPPDNTEMQAALGRYSLRTNDFAAAVEYFGKAMGGDPDNCQYMVDMGKAYEGLKEYTTALEMFKEVKRRRPDFPEIATLIARVSGK
jgi:tetratricopeptide (TPR) repeat protein